MAATGARAARAARRGRSRPGRPPAKAFRPLDFLTGLPSQCTFIEPGRRACTRCSSALEREHDAVLSFTPGFPMADFPECGMAVFGYGRRRRDACRRRDVDAGRARSHDAEPDFAMELFEPDAAVAPRDAARRTRRAGRAGRYAGQSGRRRQWRHHRTCSRALLGAIARGAVLGLLIDRASATQAHVVGIGRTGRCSALGEISGVPGHVPLGGRVHRRARWATASSPAPGRCSRASGWTWGRWRCCATRQRARRARVAASARPPTRKCSATSASSPRQQRILALKSSVHFRADFQPIAKEVLVVVAPGPAKADPTMFHWTRLRPGSAPEAGRTCVSGRLEASSDSLRTGAPLRHRADQARDEYVLAAADAACVVRTRQWTRVRRGRARALRKHEHADGARTSTSRGARAPEIVTPVAAEVVAVEQGVARDVRDAAARRSWNARARRMRRGVARPARRDGDRGLRRCRRRDRAADPRASRPRCRSRSRSTTTRTSRPSCVDNATVIAGYKTYPHVDMYEAGMLAGGILVGTLDGDDRAGDGVGLEAAAGVDHASRAGRRTVGRHPRATRARWRPTATVLAATLAAVVPARRHAVHRMCRRSSSATRARRRAQHARMVCDRMLKMAWERRAEYVFHAPPLAGVGGGGQGIGTRAIPARPCC